MPARPETASMDDLESRIEVNKVLIRLGLQAVSEELQRSVEALAGPGYQHKGPDMALRRWGAQAGDTFPW